MAFTTPLNVRKVNGSGGTTRVFPSFTATAGSTVVVRISDASGNNVSSVVDNLGNTYSLVGTKQTAGLVACWVYAKTGHSGGAGCVVTVTFSGAADATADLMEWPASTIDTGSRVQAGSTAGSPFATTSNTLASASSVVLLCIGTDYFDTASYSETTGFTKAADETNGSLYWTGASFYKVVSATTAVASSVTVTGTTGGTNGARIIFALNEAVAGTNLTPGEAAIALSGPAPTLAQTANQSFEPAEAALALSGPAPAVAQSNNQALAPGEASITLTGDAPTITQSNGLTLTPDTAALVLSGDAPTVAQSANQALTPDPASVALSGPVAVVAQSDNRSIEPAQADVVLSGPIPTITQAPAGQNDLFPGEAAIVLTGWPPTLAQSGQRGMELDYEAGPAPGKPRRVRYASIKPMLQAALESRLPEPEFEELDAPQAANALSAGIQALQNEQLTPELVVRLARQWHPAAAIASNTVPQDAQLLYLRAVLAQKQVQEAQAVQLAVQRQRAKARANDEEAIAHALALLF